MASPPGRGRARVRPVVFLLVYAVLLLVVGATASGLAMLVSANAQTMILNATVNTDASLVRSFVNLAGLQPADLQPAGRSASRVATLESGLGVMAESGQLLRIAILAPDGTVLARSPALAGSPTVAVTQGMRAVLDEHTVDAAMVAQADAAADVSLGAPMIVREYMPILLNGQALAVVAIWRDAGPILAQLEQNRLGVVGITLCGALVCAILLYFVFRAAQGRLTRQSRQLLEAARHDPLTGALNHGAIVEELALRVGQANGDRSAVGVALVDIDNFRLLNETYGHQAGDHVILEMVRLLEAKLQSGMVFGRYGPDEFLVVTAGEDALALEPAIESVRLAAAELTLRFESSERLPVSISAGLCSYPTNAKSATSLLSVATITLDEARVSGGDTVRVAEARRTMSPTARTFSVLQGLIIAVDTKDHYTRRHSEDVARYVDFMAELLGLDRKTRAALHTAGLLHDIGKIGIPDVVLRKPGRLTAEEQAIFRQHVALGDMIVRDLPNLSVVRDGIRNHHERWDGKGYLAGIAGQEIPLVARILAVGDALSAMTTTRPYRKAVSVEEALRRLEDAAGSQLDEHIVKTLIDGFASAPHPPLPGDATGVSLKSLKPEAA